MDMRHRNKIDFFCLLTEIQKDVDIVWHYFEAHLREGPMDGIGGTINPLWQDHN